MLIGFVLLVSACGHDACEALPCRSASIQRKPPVKSWQTAFIKSAQTWCCFVVKCIVQITEQVQGHKNRQTTLQGCRLAFKI